jgi:hypothetical protein
VTKREPSALQAQSVIQPDDISTLAAEQGIEIVNLKLQIVALRREIRELREGQKRPNETADEALRDASDAGSK